MPCFFPGKIVEGGDGLAFHDQTKSPGLKTPMGRRTRGGVKVAGNDLRHSIWKTFKKFHDQTGGFLLDLGCEIKVGVGHEQVSIFLFKPSNDALTGPYGTRKPGGDVRSAA